MHRLSHVVRHYYKHLRANLFKPVFFIDCTRIKVVKMCKKKLQGYKNRFSFISRIIRGHRWFSFVSGSFGGLVKNCCRRFRHLWQYSRMSFPSDQVTGKVLYQNMPFLHNSEFI